MRMTLHDHQWFTQVLVIMVVALGAGVSCVSKKAKSASAYDGGYVLRIGDRYIDTAAFNREKQDFFLRWRRSADMLRKTEEERADIMLDEFIDRTLIEDFLHHSSGITVTPEETEAYIDRYIKPKYASPEAFTEYLHNANHESEDDLKKAITLYLFKLKYFPRVAKEMGIAIPAKELDSLYQKHIAENSDGARHWYHPKDEFADMLLLERFGVSKQYKTWTAGLRHRTSIEIFDPAMNAYRLYRDGDFVSAAALYEKLYHERGKELFLERALQSHRAAKNWEAVVRLSQIGMKKYQKNHTYILTNAEGLYRSGHTANAQKLLAEFEPRTRESVYLRGELARVYQELGLENEAMRLQNSLTR